MLDLVVKAIVRMSYTYFSVGTTSVVQFSVNSHGH